MPPNQPTSDQINTITKLTNIKQCDGKNISTEFNTLQYKNGYELY